MNKGYITALVVVLVLLIGIYAFTTISRGTGTVKKPEDIQVQIDSTAINKMEVSTDDQDVVLELQGGRWMITSPIQFEADQNVASRLAQSFQTAAIDVEISDNPENHATYDLEEGKARHIKVSHGGKTLELLVGKSGPGGVTYVRLPGDNRVFSLSSYLSGAMRRSVADYRDKYIWELDQDRIRGTSVHGPEGSTYVRMENDSMFMAASKADGPWVQAVIGKATSYLGSIARMRASSFVDDADSIARLNFEQPDWKIDVTMEDGNTSSLSGIFAAEDQKYVLVTKDGRKQPVWVLSNGAMGRTVRDMDYMTTAEVPRQQPQMNSNQQITPEMQRKIQEAMMKQGMGN